MPSIDPLLALAAFAVAAIGYALLVSRREGERRTWRQMIRRATGEK